MLLSWLRFKLRYGIVHRLQAAELFLPDIYQVSRLDPEAKKRFIPGVNIACGGRLRHEEEGECRNGSCLLKGSLHISPVPGMCHSCHVLLHPYTTGALQDLREWDEDVLGEVNAVPS